MYTVTNGVGSVVAACTTFDAAADRAPPVHVAQPALLVPAQDAGGPVHAVEHHAPDADRVERLARISPLCHCYLRPSSARGAGARHSASPPRGLEAQI